MATDKTIKWTPEQEAGVKTVGMNLLVSAAAGSGKTAVLAARCVHLACDAAEPCDVDRLLVVTFTELAAGQMRDRIRGVLQKRVDDNPQDARAAEQLDQIDRAQIGTLHGFCSKLLRQHFHLVGLDPSFTILDADDAALLRKQTVRELIAERYESDADGSFRTLVDHFGDGNDEPIQGYILRTDNLLNSVVDRDEWLARARARVADASEGRLADSELGRELVAVIRAALDALGERCGRAIAVLVQIASLPKTATFLRSIAETIEDWSRQFGGGDFDALARCIVNYAPGRAPPISGDHPQRAAAVAALESARKDLGTKGSLYALARFTSAQWQEGLRSTLPHANELLDLVWAFEKRYAAAKARTRSIDFTDLERFALDVLRVRLPDGSSQPSAVALAYRARLAHVLVDEYQDINAVQDEILRLVSRDAAPGRPANLFCVGDVKQSIYRFRLAEPERFLERYHRYRRGEGGRVIDLQRNFRSRAPLLEAINALFERLMTRESADVDYDAAQRLVPGATFPPGDDAAAFRGAPIELHVLPDDLAGDEADDEPGDDPAADLDRTEREALLIARRIHELVGGDGRVPALVADDSGGLRPIRFGDVVILLRAVARKADRIAEVLRRQSIPVFRDAGGGFFDTPEVSDLLSLLQVLDNAAQDLPLVALLRSPISDLNRVEDALARIRLAYPGDAPFVPFHEAAFRYAREQTDDLAARLGAFVASLERWRQVARRRPLAELIWTLLEETGYLAYCAGLENGEQRCANLLQLHERAKQFGATAGRGLYRFLRSLDRLREETDVGTPSVLGEGEDVVRIMSVHKSKGLEFPVVFLPDLGKEFNLKDTSGRVLVDRTRYLGMSAVHEGKQVRYPSLSLVMAQRRLRQQTMAEELRVLYVALTRAKEHLILIGTASEKVVTSWPALWSGHHGAFGADVVLGAKTPLDWLGPVATALADAPEPPFAMTAHTAAAVAGWTAAASRDQTFTPWQCARAALRPLDPAPARRADVDALFKRLDAVYTFTAQANARAALSATEWAKGSGPVSSDATGTDRALALPPFMVDPAESPADRGTATHLVLQHIPFKEGADDVDTHVKLMVDKRLLTAAQAAAVDVESIAWFLATPLAARVRVARADDRLKREIPFTLALPTDGVDPAEGLDRVMVRGRIDLLIVDGASCVIVDYKTDRISSHRVAARANDYAAQVRLYRDAIEGLTKLRVSATSLIFLHARRVIDV